MFGVNRTYVSEFGTWMKEELARHPEWEGSQCGSRALWWNRKQTGVAQADFAAADVRQQPYPYDVNF